MSADDQQFLDLLSSIPNHLRQYTGGVADYVDRAVDQAADQVRESLAGASWLPDQLRPQIQTPPAPVVTAVQLSTLERAQTWITRHKVLTGLFVAAVSYAGYRTVRRHRLERRTRRARRARNGGRQDVVVIAGSPSLPLTRTLALDLERRGFIVYVVCSSMEDEVAVQNLARSDIKALSIDITDPSAASDSIERFATYLQTPHAAVPRAKPSYLSLNSVILIPSLNYHTSPIATIPPSSFADLFNTHLLHPILTIQSFLPLLTSRLNPLGTSTEVVASDAPKVLVFTPSIIPSINPPFHAPEATVCSALSAFTEVLTAELSPLHIPVTHVQLGTFDFAGFTPAGGSRGQPQACTLDWPVSARHNYARNYVSTASSAITAGRVRGLRRGSSLRELHHAVFDVLDGSDRAAVVRVGLGAGLYGFVGRWAPRGLVSWVMGVRRVDQLAAWSTSATTSPDDTPDGSDRSAGSGASDGEYISVLAGQDENGANVWEKRSL